MRKNIYRIQFIVRTCWLLKEMKFRLAHFVLYITLFFATITWYYLYFADSLDTDDKKKPGDPMKQSKQPHSLDGSDDHQHHKPHPKVAADEILKLLKAHPPTVPERVGKGPKAPMMRGPDPDTKPLLAAPIGLQPNKNMNIFTPVVTTIKVKNKTDSHPDVANSLMYNDKLLKTIQQKLLKPSAHRRQTDVGKTNNDSTPGQLSRDSLSQLIETELKGRRHGFFVQYGTDMEKNYTSNSMLFEFSKNWNGLIVEPNPSRFKRLQETNHKATALHAGFSTKQEPMKLKLKLKSEIPVNPLVKVTPSSRIKKQSEIEEIEVDCYPLNSIMAAVRVDKIDYLSLEGADGLPDILETIDWTRLRVNLISVRLFPVPGKMEETRKQLNNIRSVMERTKQHTEITNAGQNVSYVVFKRM